MKRIITAFAALLLTCSTAAAATSFNFSGNGGLASSYSFTEDGITVDVTPGVFSNGGTVTSTGLIGQYAGGLGISSHIFDDHQVDGRTRNDLAIFEFSQSVILESVSFSFVDGNDEFSFFFDNEPDGTLDPISFNIDIPGGGTYTFASIWDGTLFGIGAFDGSLFTPADNFKIKGMSVSVVPLPAALPLYGAGIVILGLVGWMRKKRQTIK